MSDIVANVSSDARVEGGSFKGFVNFAEDRDWIGVELQAGVTYTINLLGEHTRQGTIEFPFVEGVYDANGNRLVDSISERGGNVYEEGTLDIRFEFTPETTGLFFISAGAVVDDNGSYLLRVTENIDGTSGNDTLIGTDGHNIIDGLAGNDIMDGGAGNDQLLAFFGDDTMTGGVGDDTFSFWAGEEDYEVFPQRSSQDGIFGDNVITDFTVGEDTIDFAGRLVRRFEDLEITQDGNDALISFFWGDSVRLEGVDANTLTADDFSFRKGIRIWQETAEATDGNDILVGTDDQDTLYGWKGDDSISGGADDDYLRGFDGNDTLLGGAGDDIIGGEAGNDSISGGAGSDFIVSNQGNDTVFGDGGADTLETSDGNDVLDGGAGADVLRGGRGDDVITGGAGADSFVIGREWGTDRITDFDLTEDVLDFRGTGLDLPDLSLSEVNGSTVISAAGNQVTLEGVALADFEPLSNTLILESNGLTTDRNGFSAVQTADQPTEGLAAETGIIEGGQWQGIDGADPVISFSFISYDSYADPLGNPEDNGWFYASEPVGPHQQKLVEDLLNKVSDITNLEFVWVEDIGESAGDFRMAFHEFVIGGAGSTPWESPFAADVYNGIDVGEWFGEGFWIHELGHSFGFNDLPNWSPVTGNDYTVMSYIRSARHIDAVWSSASADFYMAADIAGLQHLYGVNTEATAGNDSFSFDANEAGLLATIWDYGGNDTIRIIGEGDAVMVNLTPGTWSNIGQDIVYDGLEGFQVLEPGTVFIMEEVIIENVVAAGGDDTLYGNAVGNRLVGNGGADHIEAGDGDDTIWAGAGDNGADTVMGGDGNDLIAGGAANDMVYGGTGSDSIFGGVGDDLLVAQDMDGDVVATSETDANAIWSGDGNDTIYGANGSDQLGGGLDNDHIDAAGGNDVVYGGKSGDDTLTGGNGSDNLFAGSDNDSVEGGSGNDNVFGGSGTDTVDGGDGNDEVYGGGDNDSVTGGAGADTLYGGGGDDTLTGGTGDDVYRPGVGADTLVFDGDSGTDRVIGFEAESDILDFSATVTNFTTRTDVTGAASETSSGGVDGVLIDLGGGNSVFLEGATLADLNTVGLSL